jgi:hypothetical protein
VQEIVRERSVRYLRPAHQNRIASTSAACADAEGFAAVATLYVKCKALRWGMASQPPTLREVWQAWEASGQEVWQQMVRVVAILDELAGRESFPDVVKTKQR